jgi:hypothetical protein
MTGTDVITSTVVDTLNMVHIGIDARWTGTPSGSLDIEYSLDGTNYFAGAAITDPAGSASSAQVTINNFAYRYVRVKYTNSSGTGVLNVYLTAKNA